MDRHTLFHHHCSTVSRQAQRPKPSFNIKDSVAAKLVATSESNFLDLYIQLTSVILTRARASGLGGISAAVFNPAQRKSVTTAGLVFDVDYNETMSAWPCVLVDLSSCSGGSSLRAHHRHNGEVRHLFVPTLIANLSFFVLDTSLIYFLLTSFALFRAALSLFSVVKNKNTCKWLLKFSFKFRKNVFLQQYC